MITRYDRPHRCKGCGSVENWIMVTDGLEPMDTYFKCLLCGTRNNYIVIEYDPIKNWLIDPIEPDPKICLWSPELKPFRGPTLPF